MATLATQPPVKCGQPDARPPAKKTSPEFFLACWTLACVVIAFVHAQQKLWYDEIYSYYMGLLPDLRSVVAALAAGGDLNPILFQLATRTSLSLFGAGEWAARVPAILGFPILALCLYRFVKKRLGWEYGLVALTIPAVTGAFRYAWEARPYGMVMAFTGIALVCWQEATSRRDRRRWLAGLTVAVACALLSHAWAVLLVAALGLTELARAWQRRAADWALWGCLALASTAVAGVLPLLKLARSVVFGTPLFQPSWRYIPNTYEMLVGPALWPLLGAIVLAGFWFGGVRARNELGRPDKPPQANGLPHFDPHEIGLSLAFLAVPVLAVIAAMVAGTAFMNRYGLLGVVGIALLGSWFAHRITGGDARFALRLAGMLGFSMIGQFGYWIYEVVAEDPPPAFQSGLATLAKLPELHTVSPELPVVSSSGLQFLELDLYGPPALKSRMHYLMDPEAAMRFTQSNIYEVALPNVVRLFPVKARLAAYRDFTARHPKFLVYGPYFHSLDWLHQKLIEDRADLRLIGVYRGNYGDNLLVEVTVPPQAPGR
jgi:hypothetical protein